MYIYHVGTGIRTSIKLYAQRYTIQNRYTHKICLRCVSSIFFEGHAAARACSFLYPSTPEGTHTFALRVKGSNQGEGTKVDAEGVGVALSQTSVPIFFRSLLFKIASFENGEKNGK